MVDHPCTRLSMSLSVIYMAEEPGVYLTHGSNSNSFIFNLFNILMWVFIDKLFSVSDLRLEGLADNIFVSVSM